MSTEEGEFWANVTIILAVVWFVYVFWIKDYLKNLEWEKEIEKKNLLRKEEERNRIIEENRQNKLREAELQKEFKYVKGLKENFIAKFDKDNNGLIDIIEENNEFNQLLKKHQKIIITKGKEFNQNYTHQFIKIGNYIVDKRANLQLIFDSIKSTQYKNEFDNYEDILEKEIHSYNLLLLNSLYLIVSLIEDDQITFYSIYEKFDKFGIYESNWEKEMSQKLTNIGDGLKSLMLEIRHMGNNIIDSIGDLSDITEQTNNQLSQQLDEVDSTLKVGNLINSINTYQNYKMNKSTKYLNR